MTNQTDVVVDNIEEGISSNEEADAPTTTADTPETTDGVVDNTYQTSSAEDEATTIPWWKQKRVLVIIGIVVVVIIVVVAIVLGVTLSTSNNNSSKCFGPDDGGRDGILYNAVRTYVSQDCANNKECEIAQTYGWPMNSWCVGNVKDMSLLFEYMDKFFGVGSFNEDINGWNTSSVTSMVRMFHNAKAFNQDLSNFNTSKVTSMRSMFGGAVSFNQDVSNFDLSSVTDMRDMFWGATSFNKDLCVWRDNFPYTKATGIFSNSGFGNSGCTYQDTPDEVQKGPFCASDCQSSQVVSCKYLLLILFGGQSFSFNDTFLFSFIKSTTSSTLQGAETTSGQSTPSTSSPCFAADDGGKDGVLYKAVRSYVSQDCANNEKCEIGQTYGWPMNSWCVGNVKDMSRLFEYMDTFNENISNWNTTSVTRMNLMFAYAKAFNQDLSNFDTSSVWDMSIMFRGATSFNGDISNFDTSRVTEMYAMFQGASSFNQDVFIFDISSVNDMTYMFAGATSFDKGLCSWRNNFPYTKADGIFTDSNCTYQDEPQAAQKGPFCASDCQSSQVVSCKYLLLL